MFELGKSDPLRWNIGQSSYFPAFRWWKLGRLLTRSTTRTRSNCSRKGQGNGGGGGVPLILETIDPNRFRKRRRGRRRTNSLLSFHRESQSLLFHGWQSVRGFPFPRHRVQGFEALRRHLVKSRVGLSHARIPISIVAVIIFLRIGQAPIAVDVMEEKFWSEQ